MSFDNKQRHVLLELPNFLTVLRIGLIPVLIFIFYLPLQSAHIIAAIIFALASFTDWLDGYLARKLNLTSALGEFLDPVADKLLVSTSLLLLVGAKDLNYITVPAIIIVGMEIVVSALREWMAEFGKRASIAVSYVGKIKTTVQMAALVLLLAFNPQNSLWGTLGFILIYLAALLTLWSMLMYWLIAWPQLSQKR